jgi:hypothetical protein
MRSNRHWGTVHQLMTFGLGREGLTWAQEVEQAITQAVRWARGTLEKNGINPDEAERIPIGGIPSDVVRRALRVVLSAEYLRKRFKTADPELPARLMIFCALAWSGRLLERKYELLTGFNVHEGGAKGRAARPPKLTPEQKTDIRRAMAAAKHRTKKATKEDLAKKHRISVRQIERIAKK